MLDENYWWKVWKLVFLYLTHIGDDIQKMYGKLLTNKRVFRENGCHCKKFITAILKRIVKNCKGSEVWVLFNVVITIGKLVGRIVQYTYLSPLASLAVNFSE